MKKTLVAILVMSLLFVAFPACGFADGLQTDMVKGNVGDSFTVSYVVPNRVENVGAITLYLNYDNAVLSASQISPKMPAVEDEDSRISRLAPRDDTSGSVVASWVEPYCSMVLEPEFELLTVKFTFIADTESTKITSDMIIKGMATSDSYGNDDLTHLAGVSNMPLEVATNATDKQTPVAPDASPSPKASPSPNVSTSPNPAVNSQDKNISDSVKPSSRPAAQKESDTSEVIQSVNNGQADADDPVAEPQDDKVFAENAIEPEQVKEKDVEEKQVNSQTWALSICALAVVVIAATILVKKKKNKE